MKDDQRKGNKNRKDWWGIFWRPFETGTEFEAADDSEALKYRDQNPLREEESVESEDAGAD